MKDKVNVKLADNNPVYLADSADSKLPDLAGLAYNKPSGKLKDEPSPKSYKRLKTFLKGREGINTVEVVIILAIVVGLAIIFRNQLLGYAKSLMDGIFQNTGATFDPSQISSP